MIWRGGRRGSAWRPPTATRFSGSTPPVVGRGLRLGLRLGLEMESATELGLEPEELELPQHLERPERPERPERQGVLTLAAGGRQGLHRESMEALTLRGMTAAASEQGITRRQCLPASPPRSPSRTTTLMCAPPQPPLGSSSCCSFPFASGPATYTYGISARKLRRLCLRLRLHLWGSAPWSGARLEVGKRRGTAISVWTTRRSGSGPGR
mmetsp:Transcript_4076/g.9943  ORF Transcript_4076/g.9943 Transcript_4076/m.9943 type:complete len:210 (+) Transcript_4076:1457-2086(+)